jgi:hypothetical protein
MTSDGNRSAQPGSEVPLWALTPPPGTADWPPAGDAWAASPGQPPPLATTKPNLALQRVRQAIRARHYSRRTEKAYTGWPDRLYVIDREGRIAHKGKAGPFGFKPQEVRETPGGKAYQTGYSYDVNGNVAAVRYPSGRLVSYAWDKGVHSLELDDNRPRGFTRNLCMDKGEFVLTVVIWRAGIAIATVQPSGILPSTGDFGPRSFFIA